MEETKTIEISQRLFLLIGGLIVIIAIFMVGELLYQFASLPQNIPHEISVSGEGKTFAKPDIATVSLGVTSESATSQDAVNQNNQKMDAITKAIKNLGVDDKDIKTTLYNLSPMYGSSQVGYGSFPVMQNKITGYELQQQIEVKIRNFDKINDILDSATSHGANTVGDLQFTVDDIEKVRAQARQDAIAQAKEKATLLIAGTGLQIEKIVNISEGYANPGPVYAQALSAGKDTASVAPSIQTGQLEVDSNVTLTYQVK
jgi:uncharacterized protein YggE